MTPRELIRELEYLQDLGLDQLYLPEGVNTLAALVQQAAKPGSLGAVPATAEHIKSTEPRRPEPRVADAPAPRSSATPSPGLAAPPAVTPAAASQGRSISAGRVPLPSASEAAQKPLLPLLSTQLKTSELAARPPNMYDAMGLDPKEDSLARIREDIGDCKRCRLSYGRTNIVFGSGNEQAKLVFVGEAPGEDEDLSGFPFVGKAGQLLTRMIEGTAEKEGLPILRKDVYICNVVKCRPPKNRKPENDEMEICGQFLYRQLAVLQPKAICVLGATAAQALLNTKEKMGDLRGNWHAWREIPVMVTYHPSFLLRAYSPEAKRLSWEDLKKVLHFVYDDPANLPGQ